MQCKILWGSEVPVTKNLLLQSALLEFTFKRQKTGCSDGQRVA